MKRFRFIILALIICLTSLTVLFASGCKNDSNDEDYELLYDFEEVGRNLYQLETHLNFGKISINEDTNFVSQGKISYKIQPMGYFGTTARPVLVLPTYSADYNYSFIDFTKYKSVVFDIYNAETTHLKIQVGLTYSKYTSNSTQSTFTGGVEQAFVLKPGWNTIEYEILHDYINLRGDASYIYGVTISFENSGSMSIKDSDTLYIDNVRLKKLKTEYKANSDLKLNCDEENGVYEVANFENSKQKHFFNINNPAYRWLSPQLEIVTPDNSENGNAIKVITARDAGIDNGNGPTQSGVGTFDLEGKVIKQAYENASKNAGDGNYEYYFCFEALNLSSDTNFFLRCVFTGINDQWASEGLKTYEPKKTILPNVWTSFEFNLSTIYTKNGDKTELVDGKNQTVDTIGPYLENIGAARLYYPTNIVDGREFIIDNFRIERRAKA